DALKWVDLPEGGGPVNVDLYLERGQSRKVQIVDADGKPLPGATVSGLTATYPMAFPLKGDTCTVLGLDPKQPRTVVFYHASRQLACVLKINGTEPEPMTVKLGPTATVKGRFLDLDGQPLAGAVVSESYADEAGRELLRIL